MLVNSAVCVFHHRLVYEARRRTRIHNTLFVGRVRCVYVTDGIPFPELYFYRAYSQCGICSWEPVFLIIPVAEHEHGLDDLHFGFELRTVEAVCSPRPQSCAQPSFQHGPFE